MNPLSGPRAFAPVERVINRCIDRGVTFFDTADSYGAGWAERWLGRAVGRRRGEIMIATKAGLPATLGDKVLKRLPLFPASPASDRYAPKYIESAVERSLRRLGTDYLDVMMLHSPPVEVLEDKAWIETLTKLRDRGMIRFYGVSTRSPEDARVAIRDCGVDCVQLELNPCTLSGAKPALSLAAETGTAVIARQVLGSGTLLAGIAERLEADDAQQGTDEVAAALVRFALDIPEVSVALVGMRTVEHVDANTTSIDVAPEFVARVSQIAREIE